MKKFSIEDLQAWNEEQEREDTMYVVEHYFYEKGSNGNLIEKDNDCCFAQTNDFDEAMERFNYCKKAYANELVEVKLMRASQVYAGNLEYEEIESYSNIKQHIKKNKNPYYRIDSKDLLFCLYMCEKPYT